ncbi:MAG TPA: hypothetical protein VIL72_02640 [Beijerinckiaceae bacterium]|jgi:uncharacterized membrane protein YhaH (DUF805 family)
MAALLSGEGLRTLYRSEEGVVDRRVWWLGLAPLGAALLLLTLGWLALRPYAGRGLDERAFLDPLTLVAMAFLIFYSFAVMLIAVCFVNLSMKRLRDRGRAPMLASLPPLAVLASGAAHWMRGFSLDAFPVWAVWLCDIGLVAVLVWAVVEMGVLRGRA